MRCGRELAARRTFARMKRVGRVAQLGERLVRNEEAAGSSPATSTNPLFEIPAFGKSSLQFELRVDSVSNHLFALGWFDLHAS
jgi:hypothetical protein